MLASVAVQHARDRRHDRLGDRQAAPCPRALLGRVSSLDWLISIGLLPLSFALTGPMSADLGARRTLIGAGVLGAIVTFAPVLSRRVRRSAVDGLHPGASDRLGSGLAHEQLGA